MGIKIKLSTFTISASAGCLFTGWWYRPLADDSIDGSGARRNGWISKYSLTDVADQRKPLLYQISSQFVILTTMAVARTFLFYLGDCSIKRDENYDNFLHNVTNRSTNTPLITVSNHRSLVDDPCILSGILPLSIASSANNNRYAVCSQEYAFNNKLPSLFHAYAGLGRVLPIKRGAGINQKLLLDYAHLVASGEWCHVFPEGGIWQTSTLGGRSNTSGDAEASSSASSSNSTGGGGGGGKSSVSTGSGMKTTSSKLKWGVGKIIAHAPTRPKVVPFYFVGTESIYPQHPDTKHVSNWLPLPGHRVTIRFGPEIDFEDLIRAHEEQYGPLWQYEASTSAERERCRQQQQQQQQRGRRQEKHHQQQQQPQKATTTTTSSSSSSSSSADSPPEHSVPLEATTTTTTTTTTNEDEDQDEEENSFHRHWDSSETDRLLYSKIMLRIEEALVKLNEESNRELLIGK